jgi:hypothetical protein
MYVAIPYIHLWFFLEEIMENWTYIHGLMLGEE